MFWRMIRGTLLRQKSKMFMIAFTVALGVSLATAMMNVMLGVGDKVNEELKTYGANINVVPKDASLLGDLYGLDEGVGINDKFLKEEDLPKVKQIFWGFNIVDYTPYLDTKVSIKDKEKSVNLVGTWFDKYLKLSTGEEVTTGMIHMKAWWTVDGEWLKTEDADGVMVGSILAQRDNIKIGDTLNLKTKKGSRDLTVRGIFNAGSSEDESLYANLSTVQEMTGLTGKVSKIEISAITTPDNDLAKKAAQDPRSLQPDEYETWYCTAYVSTICYQIQEVVQDGVAKPIRQVAESEGSILNKTKLLMLLITILCSIGSALGISNLVTASVMERNAEIGLIKALGGTGPAIVGLILTEIVLTGFIGGIFGYGAGIGFTQIIGKTVFGSYIELAPMVIPIDIVLVILVTMLGSIPAIRYMLKLKPTEVLHGR
ncbi:MAG: ABC transporter permease [Eubacteriales bacterium]|nr:ABC transporter permease [Eubacteriales bacterium]